MYTQVCSPRSVAASASRATCASQAVTDKLIDQWELNSRKREAFIDTQLVEQQMDTRQLKMH